MRYIFAIGGIPGTGKTTLMKKIMNELAFDWEVSIPAPLCDGQYSESLDAYVLGKYDQWWTDLEGYAQGTDKLSMAVQPAAMELIKESEQSFFFEGDRLFTATFLEHCSTLPNTMLKIIILNSNLTEERYKARGSEQSEKFIKGRVTKVDNIAKNFLLWDYINEFDHNTEDDTNKIVDWIKNII